MQKAFFLGAGAHCKEILIISQRQSRTIAHFMVTFISLKEIVNELGIHFFACSVLLPCICISNPPNRLRSACFPPAGAMSSIQMNIRATVKRLHGSCKRVGMHGGREGFEDGNIHTHECCHSNTLELEFPQRLYVFILSFTRSCGSSQGQLQTPLFSSRHCKTQVKEKANVRSSDLTAFRANE